MVCKLYTLIILCSIALKQGSSLSEKEKELCLSALNKKRLLHLNTPSLKWSETLAKRAEGWARFQQYHNKIFHHKKIEPSENIWFSTHQNGNTGLSPCERAVDRWYEGVKNYNFDNCQRKKGQYITNHFINMLWRNTTNVGVGVITKDIGNGFNHTIVVARYTPRSNKFLQKDKVAVYKDQIQPLKKVLVCLPDVHPNCGKYGTWYCTKTTYVNWAKKNCYTTCGFCKN